MSSGSFDKFQYFQQYFLFGKISDLFPEELVSWKGGKRDEERKFEGEHIEISFSFGVYMFKRH